MTFRYNMSFTELQLFSKYFVLARCVCGGGGGGHDLLNKMLSISHIILYIIQCFYPNVKEITVRVTQNITCIYLSAIES